MELDEQVSVLRTLAAYHDPRTGEEPGQEGRALMADDQISADMRAVTPIDRKVAIPLAKLPTL
jgi:hypothetical protein